MRLGVFGGTFDPPHLGHLILAAEAAEQMRLERVLWVITPDPPHKLGQFIRPLAVRLQLLEAALEDHSSFCISRVDIDRPGPQFAVDTVRLLAEQNPDAELFYLLGGDSLRDLPLWYEPLGLLARVAGLGVMRRPDDRINLEKLDMILPGIAAKTQFFDAPLIDISSSEIRDRVRCGRNFEYFVPQAVFRLIRENGWYLKPGVTAQPRP